MKREKEVPADLLAYLKKQEEMKQAALSKLDILCTMPVRAVKMKMLIDEVSGDDKFRTAIIPAVDIYVSNNPILKEEFLRQHFLFRGRDQVAVPLWACLCQQRIRMPGEYICAFGSPHLFRIYAHRDAVPA